MRYDRTLRCTGNPNIYQYSSITANHTADMTAIIGHPGSVSFPLWNCRNVIHTSAIRVNQRIL